MSQPVELGVKSSLNKIIQELEQLRDKSKEVGSEFKGMGTDVAESMTKNTKRSERFLNDLRGMGRRVADQLRGDFKTLMSINALTDAMKLGQQFRGSIKETVALSDTIRKLGTTFNIASKDFSSFQNKMVKGLGDIGLSSDVASRSLAGLAETPVRGEDNLLAYSKSAGMLASIAREEGSEGNIAGGMARVIQARGGNVQDASQMQALSEDLRKVFAETGRGPTQTLQQMEQLFAKMPKDLRQAISSSGLTNLAAASAMGGPNATKFLEEYLGKSPVARMAFEAQGGAGIFGEDGIDTAKFGEFASSIMNRVGGDPRMAAQTLGLTDDAAEGFVRLAENLDKVKAAQDRINQSSGSLAEQYRNSLGLGEAFRRNINRVKASLSEPLSFLTQKATDLLSSAGDSTMGSAGVVAGGGVLAAMLAGMGARGVGGAMGGMGGTMLKGAAAQAITGEKVQPVYVTNASEIAGMGAMGGAGKMGKGMMGKIGGLGMAAAGGVAIGKLIEPAVTRGLDAGTTSKTAEGFEGNVLERLFFKLDQLVGGDVSTSFNRNQKVIVELNKQELKASKQPTRGSSF